jgi:hypothetical protein
MSKDEKEIYDAYKDRLSMPPSIAELTEEELAELKKQGRI